MSNYTIHDIQHCLKNINHHCAGHWDEKYFSRLSTPSEADMHSLIWIGPDRQDKNELIVNTQAKIIVCDPAVEVAQFCDKAFIVTENPKLAFLRISNTLFADVVQYGVHPTAIIHPDAIIEEPIYIGPYSVVGKCHIKSHAVIHSHCHLYDNTQVGERVIVYSGCKIGAPGLGHIFNEQGNLENFPQVGSVVIDDDVELGVNVVVYRGALSATVIGRHSKIDGGVVVGHNVVVGENTMITSNSVIGGSASIGHHVFIGMNATIVDYVVIADEVHVGAGVVVMENVATKMKLVARPAICFVKNNRLLSKP